MDYVSWFTSGPGRKGIQQGLYDYIPNHYSTMPLYWREVMPRLDVFYAEVSPMDKTRIFFFWNVRSRNTSYARKSKYDTFGSK